MVNKKGIIFDILRCSITDGPGIRTTVFFKGCPLHCVWCHNPESQNSYPELLFDEAKCVMCGKCFETCKQKAHKLDEKGKHYLDRNLCINCGECSNVCMNEALEMVGKEMSVEEVLKEINSDLIIYEKSKGGVTLSGGEPMFQPEFTKVLLEECKKNKIHTCLDTCGYSPWEEYKKILNLVDLFLYDIKETDTKKHEEFTGVPFEKILENLKLIDKAGGKIALRCPIIPGLNNRSDHIYKIIDIALSLETFESIELLQYHPLGIPKLGKLGRNNELLNYKKNEGIAYKEAINILFEKLPKEKIRNKQTKKN